MSGFYPVMEPEEIAFLSECLDSSKTYLEFGAGGSTYLACENKSIEKVYSVEHDEGWIERTAHVIKNDLGESGFDKLKFYHVSLGSEAVDMSVHEWGHNVDSSLPEGGYVKYQTYLNVVNKKVDLILIDGRYRTGTALNCIKWCYHNSPNTKIMMHDYGVKPGATLDWRPEYRAVEEFVNVERFKETLYLFSIKDGKDWSFANLDTAIENNKHNST